MFLEILVGVFGSVVLGMLVGASLDVILSMRIGFAWGLPLILFSILILVTFPNYVLTAILGLVTGIILSRRLDQKSTSTTKEH